jgi:mitochondrial fission protein ELM1
MSKLKALLLTQGMHGMISQVEGLAKALNLDYKHQTIELKTLWNYIPPKFTPITENILSKKFICDAKVIISCGRKSVIPSIALKKKFGKDIFNIHIQDPKVALSNFDLVVCPKHDGLNGENILQTTGAIHYLSTQEIKRNLDYLEIDRANKKMVAFIIGGPNNYYDFSEKEIDKVFSKIKILFSSDKYKIIVIPSYRTPKEIIEKANNVFGHDHLVIRSVDKKAYLSALSQADYIVVTCDSTSMISEAAVTGKPIYVANMKAKKESKRFRVFYSQLKEINVIKDLEDKIETWSYNNLDEVNRIAPIIKAKMKSNGII